MAEKDVFDIAEMRDHVSTKGMWAGSLTLSQIKDFSGLVNGAIVPLTTNQVEALLKIINEIIVNATDHYIGCRSNLSKKGRVDKINITYKNGIVSVYNNGPGLPTGINGAATAKAGRDIYEPEVAFSNFMAGSNLVKDNTNVKGGTNGLGAKIANVHSQWFTIETIGKNKQGKLMLYKQTWRDRMREMELPIITEAEGAEFTCVSFLPAYAELNYKCGSNGLPDDATVSDICSWMHLHAHQSATYVGSGATVKFNDEPCRTTTVGDLADLLIARYCTSAHKVILHATSEEFPLYPWNIAVIVYQPDLVKTSTIKDMSIINGVISNKGPHLTYFRGLIKEAVEEKISKQKIDSKPDIAKTMQMQLVFCGAIPAADWNTQNKEEVCLDKAKLKKWKVSPASIDELAEFMAMRVMQIKSNITSSKFIGDPKHYRPARPPKGKKLLAGLMLAEGDSALSLLNNGLSKLKSTATPGDPSFEWYGTISLQGVILNAARGITEFKNEYGSVITMNDSLKNNERLNAIASVIGLQFGCQTKDRLDMLNYGKIIICVDQDTDGSGKIAGLVLVWLFTCYPGLLESGRVYKFMTPLMRAYAKSGAKSIPIDFYSFAEYKKWAETVDIGRYNIKYYKGLATHDLTETKRMFAPENFRKCLYRYTVDDVEEAKVAFNIYYGKDSSLRKIALANPPPEIPLDLALKMTTEQIIPLVDVQLHRDVCEYKRDAISRQIPNCIDGLNPARRKVLCGAAEKIPGESFNVEVKVFQLCGFCADTMYYHHGDSSLNSTITYLAQNFYGARTYPMLLPSGSFGDRHGCEPGAPRYIHVKKSPLFTAAYPVEDKSLLQYTYEEGHKAEPINLVPVIPLSILESNNNVSEGWKHLSFGRNLNQTIDAVKAYIKGDPAMQSSITALAKYPLDINADKFKGNIRIIGNKMYSVGKYVIEGTNKIRITELPIGLKTNTFKQAIYPEIDKKSKLSATAVAAIESKRYVSAIDDSSNECDVDLLLHMLPNWEARLKAKKVVDQEHFDFIENGLFLKTTINPCLNYLIDGIIVEFPSDTGYMDALLRWAPRRRDLYKVRIERNLEIATLLKLELEQIVTFVGLYKELKLSELEDDDEMNKILTENKLIKMNTTLLHSPGDNVSIKNEVLYGGNISYNYLKNLKACDFIKTAVTKFNNKIEGLTTQIKVSEDLLAESPVPCASLWLSDIDNFVNEYKKYRKNQDEMESLDLTTTSAKVVKKSRAKKA